MLPSRSSVLCVLSAWKCPGIPSLLGGDHDAAANLLAVHLRTNTILLVSEPAKKMTSAEVEFIGTE